MKLFLNQRPILEGNVTFPLMLAPMVGISHYPFRKVVSGYMPEGLSALWPTEMLNSRRLPDQKLGQTPETIKGDDEQFLCPQILGNQERYIAPSVSKLEQWGAKAIDINMGCPVNKALKHNYGVALMGDVDYAKEVVQMTVANATVPVSVKLRAGHQKDEKFLINFVQQMQNAGASWITLHPRLASEMRRGKADWSQITLVRDHLDIPVIGNGDIQTLDDVFLMHEQTNCDGVMIGRALTARPWLLWQYAKKMGLPAPLGKDHEQCPETPEQEAREYVQMLINLLRELTIHFETAYALRKFRFFVKTSCPWLNFGHSIYSGVHKNKTPIDIENFLLKMKDNSSLKMAKTTSLHQ